MALPFINQQAVETVNVLSHEKAAITHFEFAPGIGGSTIALDAMVNGKLVHVFANRDLTEFNLKFATDPNAPFKEFNVPLFPITNRLLPKNSQTASGAKDFQADVNQISVKMPFNHIGHAKDAIPHHLHGLTYNQSTSEFFISKTNDGATASTHLKNFFKGYWTSQADLNVIQSIKKGVFHYELMAKNSGSTPLPVAFGSHPYFQIPSGDPKNVSLSIPAGDQMAEIDNLDNVLPTGKLLPVSANHGRLDFTKAKALPGGVIDHFFYLNPRGQRTVELVDTQAKVKYVMTALSTNIIGVQVYYPGTGPVVAIEMVTNVPDPREELWKAVPTGMQTLKPNETAHYEYQIAVEAI